MNIIYSVKIKLEQLKRDPSLQNKLLFLLVVSSFLIRFIYVFYFTDYKNYLFSDMSGYWSRANQRYDGDIFGMWQWTAWATFFHFYLAFVFKVLSIFKLLNYKLETVLLLDIIYSTLSVLCLYLISGQILKNVYFSFVLTAFYAFCYPIVYFNAFVLSENLAIPCLMLSVYLLFTHDEKKNKLMLLASGLFLGAAVACRPAMGLMLISFVSYILIVWKANNLLITKILIFLSGFFLVISLVIIENNYISKGELKSLAGNGGVNFFINNCRVAKLKSVYKGLHVHLANGDFVNDPKFKPFDTEHPIHEQNYFYKKGFLCLKHNSPKSLIENLTNLKLMFLGGLFPTMYSAKWFKLFAGISNYLILFMFLSLGLSFFIKDKYLKNDKDLVYRNFLFMLSLIFFVLLTACFYIPEHRYFFTVIFAVYSTFFVILFKLNSCKKEVLKYCRSLFFIYLIYELSKRLYS